MSLFVSARERVSTIWQPIYGHFARSFDDQRPKGAIAALDGVRAMAFLLILYYHVMTISTHSGLWVRNQVQFMDALTDVGFTGVTLFFVLSGFLVFMPYARAIQLDKSWPEAKIFYLRRILRICPGYFFAIFLLIMLKNPDLLTHPNWGKVLPFLTFTMDFTNSQPVDGPLWTLAIECQFYLLLPFVAFVFYGLTRLVRPERRLWVLIGCLLAIIVWGVGLRYFAGSLTRIVPLPRPIVKGFLTVVFGERGKYPEDFAVGMLVAVLYVFLTNASEKERYLRVMQRLSPVLAVGAVLLFLYETMRFYSLGESYDWPLIPGLFRPVPWGFDREIDFALIYGCYIMAVLFNRPNGVMRRVFEWSPLRWLGILSFTLYIWHVPFLIDLQKSAIPLLIHFNRYGAMTVLLLLELSVTLPFCYLVYSMVEKPCMRFSEKMRQQLLLKKESVAPVGVVLTRSEA